MNPLLILRLAANDCKSRFAGSVLGSFWGAAMPAVTVCIYWFVYTTALKGTPINGVPYILWLVSGISLWFFLSDGICTAASCLLDYRYLLRKTRFKSEYLPPIRIISVFYTSLPIFVIAYVILIFGGIKPSLGQLWAVYWIVCCFAFILGIGRILAVLCVYIKDLVYAANVIIQFGFWITPIFWPADSLSPFLYRICFLNPAAIIIDSCRNALLYGTNASAKTQIYFWGITAVINLSAYFISKKAMPTIADRL